jgi:hypothetical protein
MEGAEQRGLGYVFKLKQSLNVKRLIEEARQSSSEHHEHFEVARIARGFLLASAAGQLAVSGCAWDRNGLIGCGGTSNVSHA